MMPALAFNQEQAEETREQVVARWLQEVGETVKEGKSTQGAEAPVLPSIQAGQSGTPKDTEVGQVRGGGGLPRRGSA